MSIRAMSAVWERSSAKGSELLLLLAIADFADDTGSNAYPRMETLAAKVRMSRRSVIRLVDKLVDAGELVVEQGAGAQYDGPVRSNRYSIPFVAELSKGDNMTRLESSKGDNMTRSKVTNSTVKGDIAMSHDPLLDPSTTNVLTENARAELDESIRKAAEILSASPISASADNVPELVERSLVVVEGIDRELAPAIAEEFTRYYESAAPSRKPKDWYRAWLNWLKVERRKEAGNGNAKGRPGAPRSLSGRDRGSDRARGARKLSRFDPDAAGQVELDLDY